MGQTTFTKFSAGTDQRSGSCRADRLVHVRIQAIAQPELPEAATIPNRVEVSTAGCPSANTAASPHRLDHRALAAN